MRQPAKHPFSAANPCWSQPRPQPARALNLQSPLQRRRRPAHGRPPPQPSGKMTRARKKRAPNSSSGGPAEQPPPPETGEMIHQQGAHRSLSCAPPSRSPCGPQQALHEEGINPGMKSPKLQPEGAATPRALNLADGGGPITYGTAGSSQDCAGTAGAHSEHVPSAILQGHAPTSDF
ncbi:hypothetical protein NDU88_004853 [Pleurodeles waltl]|uniref:Uncharacterized protein n=1 Tax=Pleurodeles waltl TaxID=8319 RepID=A0AAV7WAY0_PLEWA|nr:hypothetical protein NDU88_004853 [Pleurodeles waltl]